MKTCFRLWSLGLGLLAFRLVLSAEPLPWPDDAAPAESVLKKSARLILEKAGRPGLPEKPAPVLPPKDSPEDVLQLEPFIVHGPQGPALPPALHETPLATYIRTGNLWEKIGRKITTEIFCRPDKGLGLSFSW